MGPNVKVHQVAKTIEIHLVGKKKQTEKNTLKSGKSNYSSNNIFLDSLGCTLSVCTICFVGEILEQEMFQVKVGTHTFAWAGPGPGQKAIGQ